MSLDFIAPQPLANCKSVLKTEIYEKCRANRKERKPLFYLVCLFGICFVVLGFFFMANLFYLLLGKTGCVYITITGQRFPKIC